MFVPHFGLHRSSVHWVYTRSTQFQNCFKVAEGYTATYSTDRLIRATAVEWNEGNFSTVFEKENSLGRFCCQLFVNFAVIKSYFVSYLPPCNARLVVHVAKFQNYQFS